MIIKGFDTDNPLLGYATDNLWGNPEENHQYQIKTNRISDYYGDIDNFSYMSKWRTVPKKDTLYYVFCIGGLDPGFWNFRTNVLRRNPLDRWINIGDLCNRRGLQLDIYNTRGYQFSRSKAWVMMTYDGLTFIALEKSKTFLIPIADEIYLRCYTPSVSVSQNEQTVVTSSNPFVYETMVYERPTELDIFVSRYKALKAKAGFTGVIHNGAYFTGAPNEIALLAVGDVVEIFHDPTVIRVETYAYKSLKDFYSTLDKKRKLIIHPAKRKDDFTFRHFDDNDFYLLGKGKYGLYFHRNSETAIRQLTHVDVAIADDAILMASEYHPDLKLVSDIKIMVLVRKTDWEFQWPHEHQRIRYLYRLSDNDIISAMTGERSTVPEWTAANLEAGPVMSFTRKQINDLNLGGAKLAVGYNAATRVLSETPVKAKYLPGADGVKVPITYQQAFTAWEYDEQGLLLGYSNQTNRINYAPVYPGCKMVEFISGHYGRKLDYVITKSDIPVSPINDFRVYTVYYNIANQAVQGELTDVTGDKTIYEVVNGVLVWKGLDLVNQRGVLLFNTASLAYTFELDHIDHSLSFAITHIYEDGGLIFPISFANHDLFLNGHSLIDNVDFVFDKQYFHIFNKEFIVEGPQVITFRGHQFHEDQTKPKTETELGFVDGGVIGRFPRYNLRSDRVTRTVINGRLFITDDVPKAETHSPDNLWNDLNGRPYMVKHVYCPIKYVERYNNFPGYKESRDVDRRVSDYLTKWLPKPNVNPVIPNLQDKYRLFSPLMNVVVNAILNKLLVLPALEETEEGYTEQFVYDQISEYLWWLDYDPIILEFDLRYFAVMPYANFDKVTVTSDEMAFLRQVNASYLNSVCAIEGHFEVNNNVR